MGYFKKRKCLVCGIEFDPTNTKGKRCPICSELNKQEITKKWISKNKDYIKEYQKQFRLKRKSEKELKSNKKEVKKCQMTLKKQS